MAYQVKTYEFLAREIIRRNNALKDGNTANAVNARYAIQDVVKNLNGSGIEDAYMDMDNPERINLHFDYHCMDANGYYCGYLGINVTIKASLAFGYDFRMRLVSGSRYRYNLVKEDLEQDIVNWLDTLVSY